MCEHKENATAKYSRYSRHTDKFTEREHDIADEMCDFLKAEAVTLNEFDNIAWLIKIRFKEDVPFSPKEASTK